MQFHKTVGKLYQIKIFDNNNRIAMNTLLLYFRMLFMMVVSYIRAGRLGEKGGAFFNAKEGRDDFRKRKNKNKNTISL